MDTRSVMFNFIQGSDITGHSSYDIWKSLNPEGTEAEFLKSLKGESAYESWLKQEGNAGKTEADFVASLGSDEAINTEIADRKAADTQVLADAKAYADEKIGVEKTARESGDTQTLTSAKGYTDEKVGAEKSARESADTQTLTSAKGYTDEKVAALVGAAPTTMDTLEELGNLLKTNEDAVDALNEAIGSRVLNTTYETKVAELEKVDTNNLATAKTYTDQKVDTEKTARESADTQTLTDSKSYTDEKVGAEKSARESGDTQTLTSAKGYTDEKLNTLNLAKLTSTDVSGILGTANTTVNAQQLISKMAEKIVSLEEVANALSDI